MKDLIWNFLQSRKDEDFNFHTRNGILEYRKHPGAECYAVGYHYRDWQGKQVIILRESNRHGELQHQIIKGLAQCKSSHPKELPAEAFLESLKARNALVSIIQGKTYENAYRWIDDFINCGLRPPVKDFRKEFHNRLSWKDQDAVIKAWLIAKERGKIKFIGKCGPDFEGARGFRHLHDNWYGFKTEAARVRYALYTTDPLMLEV